MLNTIAVATKKCQEAWKECKAPVQVKSLVNQLTLDIQTQMDKGEWDFAVKLGSYRHEIGKIYSSLDPSVPPWYEAFIEIRKTRDTIALLTNDNRT